MKYTSILEEASLHRFFFYVAIFILFIHQLTRLLKTVTDSRIKKCREKTHVLTSK